MSDIGWRSLLSAGELRRLGRFVGARALTFGAVTTAIGLLTFVVDLAFAVALQRFLVAIALVPPATALPWLGPVQSPLVEASLFLAVGLVRVGATFANGLTTGLSYVAFEAQHRADIVRWAIVSGRAPLGRVTTLFNDAILGASATVSNVFFLLGRGVLVTGTLVALAVYSWRLTALLLLLLVLAIPLQKAVDAFLSGVSRIIQRSLAQAVDRLAAGVKNAVFLQIHGLVDEEARRVVAHTRDYAASSRRYYILSSLRVAIPQTLALIVVVGIAAQGGALLGDDKSRIVAYLYLALRMFQSLGETARIFANLRLNWPRLGVLYEWWEAAIDRPGRLCAPRRASASDVVPFDAPVGWRCSDVDFSWDPGVPVLAGLSATIAPGSMTVVTGPSGTGKSSLLLLLTGLAAPSSGAIALVTAQGEGTLAVHGERLLASTAFVGPDPFVVPGTIRDFLALGLTAPADAGAITQALAQAQCDFVARLPRGLDHPITEQGGGLSAGQKQRLALARALLRRPKVLLLDEATANLDDATESAIVSSLAALKGRMTIIAITHRQALQAIADQVIALAPARLDLQGASE